MRSYTRRRRASRAKPASYTKCASCSEGTHHAKKSLLPSRQKRLFCWHMLHNLIQSNAKSRSVAGLTAPNPQPDLSVPFLRASEGFFKQTDVCHPLIRSCCLNLLITEYLRGNGRVQHPCGSAGASCSGKRSCSAAGLLLHRHNGSLPFPAVYP